jgi:hypothetical protein
VESLAALSHRSHPSDPTHTWGCTMLSKLFALAFVVGFFAVAYFVVAGPTLVALGR